jgi:hypothetical protein
MNYQRIYDEIINNAICENRVKHNGIYYENHHILPKCLSGTNDDYNLVLLTGREHFVCHKLLTKLYPDNRKIALAFHKMSFSKKEGYKISSRDFERARELISEIPVSEETKNKIRGRKHTKEEREKISKALIGKKKSEKHKEAIKNANIGQKRPDWVKKKMSEARKKLFDEGYKLIVSEETKKKISRSNLGKNNGMFGKRATNALIIKINEKIFNTMKEAEEYTGMKSYQIYYRMKSDKYLNFVAI